MEGKQTPCPACKRIVKVPRLVKEQKKDWRNPDDSLPAGARRDTAPEPEGAWGAGGATSTVSRAALAEAGISTEPKTPRSKWQKIRLGLIAAAAVLAVLFSSLAVLNFLRHRDIRGREDQVRGALTGQPPLAPEAKAALYQGLGELNWKRRDRDQALADFQNARGALHQQANRTSDGDVTLIETALALSELGGDKEQVRERVRHSWNTVLTELGRTVAVQQSQGGRLEAIRELCRKLIDNQLVDVTGLSRHLAAQEQPEAVAMIGLERLRAGQKELAKTLADAAHDQIVQAGKAAAKEQHSVPASHSLVALWTALDKQEKLAELAKVAAQDERGVFAHSAGAGLGLAYRGDLDQARTQILQQRDLLDRLRGLALLAVLVLENDPQATKDLEDIVQLIEALKGQLGEEMPTGKPDVSWLLYRLVAMCAKAGQEEQGKKVALAIPDLALRGRAQLALLRARLERQHSAVPDSAADDVEQQAPAHPLARQLVARNNTYYGSPPKNIDAWDAPERPFGYMGIALGLQDKDR